MWSKVIAIDMPVGTLDVGVEERMEAFVLGRCYDLASSVTHVSHTSV
jgi:ABC-type phosphonate transport system ATPase subunit